MAHPLEDILQCLINDDLQTAILQLMALEPKTPEVHWLTAMCWLRKGNQKMLTRSKEGIPKQPVLALPLTS